MKKKEIIQKLNNQLDKLDNLTINQGEDYVDQTKGIIVDVFSRDSEEFKRIDKIQMKLDVIPYVEKTFIDDFNRKKEKLKGILTDCIKTVDAGYSIKKKLKTNMFSDLSRFQLFQAISGIIIGTATIVVPIAFYLGSEKQNLETTRLMIENNELKRKIDSLTSASIQYMNHMHDTSTTQKTKTIK